MIFVIKRKIYNFDPNNVLLAIATNTPQRLKTAFVLQGSHLVNIVILLRFFSYIISFFLSFYSFFI